MDNSDRTDLVNRAITAFAQDLEYVIQALKCLQFSEPPDNLVVWGSPPRFVEKGPLSR